MIQFLLQHQFGFGVAIYWIFSAAVSALPEPSLKPGEAGGYLWLYRFVHTIAGNLATVLNKRVAGLKIIAIVLVAPLLVTTPACAAHYRVRPGALNAADSAAYDTLLTAESAIDQARAEPLSPGAKDALNTLIHSYNVARESWLAYRGAVSTNVPPDLYVQQLTKDLSDLMNALKGLRESAPQPIKRR